MSFIFREQGSTSHYFQGVREQALKFGEHCDSECDSQFTMSKNKN